MLLRKHLSNTFEETGVLKIHQVKYRSHSRDLLLVVSFETSKNN